jgi:hypothetical protein
VLPLVLYTLLAIAVMVAVFFIVASLLPAGEQIAQPVRDERPWELPDEQELGADDVAAVRLPVALRGYRFAETDQLLDRLGEALRSRDELIARLRALPTAPAPSSPPRAPGPTVGAVPTAPAPSSPPRAPGPTVGAETADEAAESEPEDGGRAD